MLNELTSNKLQKGFKMTEFQNYIETKSDIKRKLVATNYPLPEIRKTLILIEVFLKSLQSITYSFQLLPNSEIAIKNLIEKITPIVRSISN